MVWFLVTRGTYLQIIAAQMVIFCLHAIDIR